MSSDAELIKERLDIVDLVSEYIPLKQSGTNWKTRCPFHQEKTPSFMVSRERQSWHCFGCSKGGDAFSFVEEIEGLTFPEALKLLAGKAGVTLTRETRNDVAQSARNRVLDILSFAANWYHQGFLKSPRAEIARTYMRRRGVPEALIVKFRVGYVPDEWDLLTRAFTKRGTGIEDCLASGLSIQKEGRGGGYDRFRGRVMFPISDIHGNVVGFTGRLLEEKENAGGKYVNTPQTLVYDKSRVIYGLDLARQIIRREKYAIVVEGQMDVIAAHKAGTENVVASSGTAFTLEQLTILKRYASELRIAFDMDAAGLAAAVRGVEAALSLGFDVKVIMLPPDAGKDPDECIQKDPAVWQRAIADAKPFMLFLIDSALGSARGKSIRDLSAAIIPALRMIRVIPSAVERGYWIHILAEKSGAREDDLRAEIRAIGAVRPVSALISTSVSALTTEPVSEKSVTITGPDQHRMERLLAIMLKFPRCIAGLQKSAGDFFPADALFIFRAIVLYYGQQKPSSWQEGYQAILQTVGEERKKYLEQLLFLAEGLELSEKDAVYEASILSLALWSGWQKREREQAITEIRSAEARGDRETVTRLLLHLKNLN